MIVDIAKLRAGKAITGNKKNWYKRGQLIQISTNHNKHRIDIRTFCWKSL